MAFAAVSALAAATTPTLPRMRVGDVAALSWPSNHVELVGRISAMAGSMHFTLSDETGTVYVSSDQPVDCRCGDTVRMKTLLIPHASGEPCAYATSVKVLSRSKTAATSPVHAELRDLRSESWRYKAVTVEGTITDVFRDELDPAYVFMVLETFDAAAVVYFRDASADLDEFRRFIDVEVRATGICLASAGGFRRRMRHSAIAIDPKTALVRMEPQTGRYPHRESVKGTVLATFGENALYLATDDGERMKVYPEPNVEVPPPGALVNALGFIRKNIFFASLSNARIDVLPGESPPPEQPVDITPRQLLYDQHGKRKIQAKYEGRAIRFSGVVTGVSESGTPNARLTVNSGGISASVRIGGITPPQLSSEVTVSGICSIDVEANGGKDGFVRLTGFSLITRFPGDIVVLRTPPWWTPLKFLMVIAALVVAIVATLMWNRSLRTLAERRGQELLDEQLGRVASELRVNERTHLAVELHDALSQNMAGIALQLDAVARFADKDRGKMMQHLDMAIRTLRSCRAELRNCLWDLKNHALEERNLNEAVRRTVSPFVGDARLSMGFDVPRDQLSDNTVHALMRIVRELAANAVRHGHAESIAISGSLCDGWLRMSVSDDGIGFDTENHPSVREGHFGLEGIRERVNRLGGNIEILSSAGSGTSVTINLPT